MDVYVCVHVMRMERAVQKKNEINCSIVVEARVYDIRDKMRIDFVHTFRCMRLIIMINKLVTTSRPTNQYNIIRTNRHAPHADVCVDRSRFYKSITF